MTPACFIADGKLKIPVPMFPFKICINVAKFLVWKRLKCKYKMQFSYFFNHYFLILKSSLSKELVSYDVPFSPVSSPPMAAVLDLTDTVRSFESENMRTRNE